MTGTVIANCITLDRVTIENTWQQRRKVRKQFGCSLDALSLLLEGQSAKIGATPPADTRRRARGVRWAIARSRQ